MTLGTAAGERGADHGVDPALLERIKISVLSVGIEVPVETMAHLQQLQGDVLTIHEYPTTGGLTFELPGGVFLNAPFDEPFCAAARVRLVLSSDTPTGLALMLDDDAVPVLRFFPLPGYLQSSDTSDRRVTDVAMSHLDRVRLSPIMGCAYDCSFCDLPSLRYELRPAEQLVEALHVALADEALPVRHVLLSGGSPRKAQYDDFEAACVAVAESCPVPLDIMMSPMVGNLGFLDRAVAAGVDGFAINIELYSETAGLEHLGRKYRTSRRHFVDFVSRAVELTGGAGRVRSLIIPGLEPLDETLAGVELIASLGADPVLSPFRPAAGTALSRHGVVPEGDLAHLLTESRQIVAQHGVCLGPRCLPCQHNTLTFPWDVA